MTRLTRFERKILFAIAVVAVAPLIGALLLGRTALREAYQVGVNSQIHGQIEKGLDVYRAYFVALRDDAERTADAVGQDYRLRDAVAEGDSEAVQRTLERSMRRYPNVARIVVRTDQGELARVEREDRLDPGSHRLLTRDRTLSGAGGSHVVEVTLAAPLEPFREFQKAGEMEELYSRLRAGTDTISSLYLGVYIALLLSIIVVAMAAGFILSRRVTRRVADLAEATQRVGAGDLTVRVPTGADDEVGELTDAFNSMVRDMRESRQRIEYLQRISAWQEFARRLAHEIKNPLTPIQLAVQEVHQAYEGDDARYRRTLDDARAIVEEEVATLRRLVGEFGAFAKLPEAHLESADLKDFIGDIQRTIGTILEDVAPESAGIVVECDSEDSPMPVRIDAMMLKRCVDNLVRNAVQAVRGSGADEGHVRVSARVEGNQAVLEVSDDGPGIPARERQRVFDPYYTTKSEGTGLGLAIVKKVVLEHGGEIECAEAPEGGALFQVRLPLVLGRRKRMRA